MATVTSRESSVARFHDGGSERAGSPHPRRHPAESHHHGHATRPRLPWLWHFATEYLLLLPIGAAIALIWANTAPESYFRTTFSLQFIVNDVLMVLFFGLVMKEVAEATAPGGVLHPWRRAMLPFLAAVGMTVLPAIVFAFVVPLFDEPRIGEGWPVVFATDLAFGYFIARVIFGRHPVIPFFLLLAICANALGVLALAVASPAGELRVKTVAILMLAAIGTLVALRRARVRSFWPYLLVGGGLSWCAFYFGGFEPALALVPVVAFLPHARRDPGFFVEAAPTAHDTLSRFELWCRHPAHVALFLFGLVNAGVPFKALDWGTLSLPITTLMAKPVGLFVGVGVALALGLHLPHRVGWRELTVLGFVTAIGFTGALFFATASLGPGPALSAVKMGALVSLSGAFLAVGAAGLLRTGKFAR